MISAVASSRFTQYIYICVPCIYRLSLSLPDGSAWKSVDLSPSSKGPGRRSIDRGAYVPMCGNLDDAASEING